MREILGSDVRQIEPFGLEIRFDLAQGLSPDDGAALKDLFYRHKLLLFRNQNLTREQQFDVLGHIGPVDRASPLDYVTPDDTILGSRNLAFHSDMHFAPFPAEGVSLLALDVEDDSTYTAFVDAAAAYDRLPDEAARRIDKLKSVRAATPGVYEDELPYELPEGMHSMEREAVMRHPVTGEPIVYVARCSTSRLVGLDREDSTALLHTLYDTLYDEAHMLKHWWRNGDLLIWDNLALQHARPDIEGITRRKLQRVTVATHDQSAQIPAGYVAPVDVDGWQVGTDS
ncbi:MAG: TauD/TfdA family dioxygenase [Novosphingobium sp.]|nr:TauD/TfdA family dioxygenase [Novosphingobium sp.]